jgi:hypothetical protein
MAKRGNSNNWVVSGERTASGRPILANDPHLMVEFPATWYEMHLVAAGLDVAGVTLPGVPFVVIGHNARIAWGFTNSNADVQDLYLERIDVGRATCRRAVGSRRASRASRFPCEDAPRPRPTTSGRPRTGPSTRTPRSTGTRRPRG